MLIRALRSDEAGFTLIELLTAMVVLIILVTAFAMVFQTTITRSSTLTEHAALESEGRAVVDTLASELRQGACNGSIDPIVTATHTQLVFYTPDRQTPFHMREVSYTLTGGALTEQQSTATNTGGPPWTFPAFLPSEKRVGSVTNAVAFQYADLTYNNSTSNNDDDLSSGGVVSAGNLPNIAYVTITLNLQPANSGTADPINVQSTVFLRTQTC